MRVRIIITLFLTLCIPPRIFAWGRQGHKIIVQIAKSQVHNGVAELVTHYLKGMSWEEAACWMDEKKGSGSAGYMKEWHYANVPRDKTYVKSRRPDVVNQLEYYLKILRNRSMYSIDTIQEALKVVFHLTGDISQPLHCGYADDHGGTTAHLKFLGRSSNLHHVWDSEIIERKKTDIWTCSKNMLELTPEEKKEIQNIDLVAWLDDSRRHLEDVYDFSNDLIDQDYVDRNSKVIEKQLVKAGLRLAAILDANFKRDL